MDITALHECPLFHFSSGLSLWSLHVFPASHTVTAGINLGRGWTEGRGAGWMDGWLVKAAHVSNWSHLHSCTIGAQCFWRSSSHEHAYTTWVTRIVLFTVHWVNTGPCKALPSSRMWWGDTTPISYKCDKQPCGFALHLPVNRSTCTQQLNRISIC